jgi:hypothetical protein
MSEPDSKLSNWCRHLIEAYVTLAASGERQYTAKGGAYSKLASPSSIASEDDECETEGYAGGAEGESGREDAAPGQELVQLIQDVQPSASASGESLVPSTLPREVRVNICTVKLEQFYDVFGVETALEKVKEGTISRHELMCMYMRSFRNVLYYDLSDLRDHRIVFDRILGYCTHVLQDVVESLYPEQQEPEYLEQMIVEELQVAKEQQMNGPPSPSQTKHTGAHP